MFCNQTNKTIYDIRNSENDLLLLYSLSFNVWNYFLGQLSTVHSQHIFKIQKRMIRLITNLGVKDSCRYAFKELVILPLYSQYLYSLLMFVAKNRDLFKANTNFHSIGTRHKNDLHLPSAQLKVFQKGVFFEELRSIITCQ